MSAMVEVDSILAIRIIFVLDTFYFIPYFSILVANILTSLCNCWGVSTIRHLIINMTNIAYSVAVYFKSLICEDMMLYDFFYIDVEESKWWMASLNILFFYVACFFSYGEIYKYMYFVYTIFSSSTLSKIFFHVQHSTPRFSDWLFQVGKLHHMFLYRIESRIVFHETVIYFIFDSTTDCGNKY